MRSINVIPDVSDALSRIEAHPQAINGICRGLERETLRINATGRLAQTNHPRALGAALTHKWITTDFAEALLEFITPVDNDIDHMLTILRDLHRYVARHLNNDEMMWPMSMQCFIDSTETIKIAQYGNSNVGRIKTLYRKGLKKRYGALMQLISGVHYNFSLPLAFWKVHAGITDTDDTNISKELISAGYLRLIRNYHRFGWAIPYLFGASPGIWPSLLKSGNDQKYLPFQKMASGLIYLPYATSLRLSNLGYTNKSQNQLAITFNTLEEYVHGLYKAITTPYPYYQQIGLQQDGNYLQLNTNILQMENELYEPIRPKIVTKYNESQSHALMHSGIEYIEVRSLDINPFSPIGVTEEQMRFLDLFLIWCALADAPEMSAEELRGTRINWNRIILEGRKPGLTINLDCCSTEEQPLSALGKVLFRDLRRVAETLDWNNGNMRYQQVCDELVSNFDHPELTLSARVLEQIKDNDIDCLGLMLANKYHRILCEEKLELFSESQFNEEQTRSWQHQRALEAADTLSFEEFLDNHNNGRYFAL